MSHKQEAEALLDSKKAASSVKGRPAAQLGLSPLGGKPGGHTGPHCQPLRYVSGGTSK